MIRRRRPAWNKAPQVPLGEARFSVLDFETTGLDLARDEVCSVGVVHVQAGRVREERFYREVSPGRPSSDESVAVHTLRSADLADAPPFDDVLDDLCAFLDGTTIVAHAAWIETAFLNRALGARRLRLPEPLLDTAAMARRVGLWHWAHAEVPLEHLARKLDLPVLSPHHALGDAYTTAIVFMALSARLARDGEPPVTDLRSLRRVSIPNRSPRFGRRLGREPLTTN